MMKKVLAFIYVGVVALLALVNLLSLVFLFFLNTAHGPTKIADENLTQNGLAAGGDSSLQEEASVSQKKIFLKIRMHFPAAIRNHFTPGAVLEIKGVLRRMTGNHPDQSGSLSFSFYEKLPLEEAHSAVIRIPIPLDRYAHFFRDYTGNAFGAFNLVNRFPAGGGSAAAGASRFRFIFNVKADPSFSAGELDLGEVFATNYLPLGERPDARACLNSGGNFSVTIKATPEFVEKAGGRRVAVFIAPFYMESDLSKVVAVGEGGKPHSLIYSGNFWDSKRGEAFTFQVPRPRITPPDYISGYAAICENEEDLNQCADRHYPGIFPSSPDGKGFPLLAEGLRYIHCSDGSSAKFLLHAFPNFKVGDRPRGGKERNASLPEEIIEGQLL